MTEGVQRHCRTAVTFGRPLQIALFTERFLPKIDGIRIRPLHTVPHLRRQAKQENSSDTEVIGQFQEVSPDPQGPLAPRARRSVGSRCLRLLTVAVASFGRQTSTGPLPEKPKSRNERELDSWSGTCGGAAEGNPLFRGLRPAPTANG